jgi:cytochrome b561
MRGERPITGVPDQPSARYTSVAVVLHWLLALGILSLLMIGLAMTQLSVTPLMQFSLYQLHKSVGITVLLLVVLRLIWRLLYRPPPMPDAMSRFEQRAAESTHLLFYILMLGLPLSGWALVSASIFNIPTVLYGIIPWPNMPILSNLSNKAPVEITLKTVHIYGAWFLLAVVALHLGAVLRHQFILRDDVLRRMSVRLPPYGSVVARKDPT